MGTPACAPRAAVGGLCATVLTVTHLVPLICGPQESELALWEQALNAQAVGYRVVAARDLSVSDRERAEVAVVANPDPSQIASFPGLKWVQSLWAGVEKLVNELPASLPIVRLVDPALADTMAQAVLSWVLYLHRNHHLYREQQQRGVWQPHSLVLPQDRKVAVLGMGELGLAAGLKLHQERFEVTGWSRTDASARCPFPCFAGQHALPEVLAKADIVVVLLPLTAETEGLLGADLLPLLPAGASLINFARGPIVVEQALLAALDNQLAHAVLDVFNTEPLPASHPFWQHNKVTVLPHVSAQTSVLSASRIASQNLQRWFDSGVMPPSVDRVQGY